MFVIIVIHSYFVCVSQGSVEMHLRCGGIYNNHAIVGHMSPLEWCWRNS